MTGYDSWMPKPIRLHYNVRLRCASWIALSPPNSGYTSTEMPAHIDVPTVRRRSLILKNANILSSKSAVEALPSSQPLALPLALP